jgi:hypothetical protein
VKAPPGFKQIGIILVVRNVKVTTIFRLNFFLFLCSKPNDGKIIIGSRLSWSEQLVHYYSRNINQQAKEKGSKNPIPL